MSAELLVLGLGSNQGDRAAYLRHAITYLQRYVFVEDLRQSYIYETPALLKPGSPSDWNIPYLNMAVCGLTTMSAQEILSSTQAAEVVVGRVFRGVWAPREIDIDILSLGHQTVNDDDLVVPHPHIFSRPFVLAPLKDLFPASEYASAFFDVKEKNRPPSVYVDLSTEK